ncbi:MAG TPA: flagellar protein FlaG [Bryobacteraceae bacterium]|nr:flagellar protein FlaG [Bryobacteraceae bacterium]
MNVSSISPVGASTPHSSNAAQSSQSQGTAAERRSLASVARVVNDSKILGQQNELVFALDPTSHTIVARILDRDTQKVLEQIPPEYILQLAKELSGKPVTVSR